MATSYLERLLSENETIKYTARQHWFILASSIFLEVALILVIFGVGIGAGLALGPTGPFAIPLIIIIGAALLAIPIITMTRDILIYTHHQFIITNRRVMQITGIINKNVIDSSLEKVNDVKMDQSFFGRIFGYGNIEILTASELGVNLFKRIENPIQFKTAMLNAKAKLDNGVIPVEPAPDIPAMIAKLAELRTQGIISEEEFQVKKSALLAKL